MEQDSKMQLPTAKQIRSIEERLRAIGKLIEREEHVNEYLEDSYSLNRPPEHWSIVLQGDYGKGMPPRVYQDFIHFLQDNDQWPRFPDFHVHPRLEFPESDKHVKGWVVSIDIYPVLLNVNNQEIDEWGNELVIAESEVFIDYPSVRQVAWNLMHKLMDIVDLSPTISKVYGKDQEQDEHQDS